MLLLGIMSGTSLDGVDVALTSINDKEITTLNTQFTAFDPAFRKRLAKLAVASSWEPDNYYTTEHQLTSLYANAVTQLLVKANVEPSEVSAVACHGQTVRHRPDLQTPYTVQMVNGALLSEKTGITVITDFRARDMAAGGEGAPLAPGFHYQIFSDSCPRACIVNIGGIANLTYWDEGGTVTGYDTGPGNVLIDGWMQQQFATGIDEDGQLCQTGKIDQSLLATMREDLYFSKSSPKSTGREYFNMAWLEQHLAAQPSVTPINTLTTLAELTCTTIADEVRVQRIDTVLICGGGVKNKYLMNRLQQLLPNKSVQSTQNAGIYPNFVEAVAFAWFGYQTLHLRTSNYPSVTGAHGPRILGAIYPK